MLRKMVPLSKKILNRVILARLGGEAYRKHVFAYIDKEDSPRSLPFQLDLLKAAGFSHYDVLHRTSVFACYVAVK